MVSDQPGVAERMASTRLLPVLTVDDAGQAVPLGETLLQGGLDLAEVTFRTPTAEDALRAMATVPGLCVGAGTVLRIDQVDRAVDAGARFIVTPGLNADVVRRCLALSVPVFPGVATATEVMRATDLGLDVVKLFPAEHLGGVRMLAALGAPFPALRFVPTGGIDAASALSYLRHPAVLAVGGSWMAPAGLVRAGDWEQIRRLTAAAVDALASLEVPR
ncbi:MAG TPA: bifunctional 4-hydroxy-2-oxoglutarate aldolase/2-dehydro-3-deoxy-phosphogluconate aldolase [Nocardioidaceae bacterium]|nr:bifunctional 4-hydroxy-2-oxoglutarate aldolase/2-dehydro-3-deoxy-phosphogluconate aldolase [Nocardioidaceae bacterium]